MPLYKVKLAKIVNKFPTEQTVYYDCKDVIELYKVIESRPDWERVTSFDIKVWHLMMRYGRGGHTSCKRLLMARRLDALMGVNDRPPFQLRRGFDMAYTIYIRGLEVTVFMHRLHVLSCYLMTT